MNTNRDHTVEAMRLRRALTHWADGLDTLADEMREEGYIMNSEQVKAITAGIRHILEGHNEGGTGK